MTTQQAKPKVLVADDERVIADTLAIILNQSGFEATAVYNGEKAVEAARIIRPDMLISDVIMTDMNGIDAAITIRGMLPELQDPALFRPGGHCGSSRPRPRPGPRIRDSGKTRTPAGSAGPSSQLGPVAALSGGGLCLAAIDLMMRR